MIALGFVVALGPGLALLLLLGGIAWKLIAQPGATGDRPPAAETPAAEGRIGDQTPAAGPVAGATLGPTGSPGGARLSR